MRFDFEITEDDYIKHIKTEDVKVAAHIRNNSK